MRLAPVLEDAGVEEDQVDGVFRRRHPNIMHHASQVGFAGER
jgi:hypothetical protein